MNPLLLLLLPEKNEIWKCVTGWTDYDVSNFGNVRTWKDRKSFFKKRSNVPRLLKPGIQSNGYKQVVFWNKRKASRFLVSRLVAQEFIGFPPFDGAVVDHIDRNKHNNHYTNLRYLSSKENMLNSSSPAAINSRKTHCPRGHAFILENLCRWELPRRSCLICKRNREKMRMTAVGL